MRVLLVDDDPEIRAAYGIALRRLGHEVSTAARVAEVDAALSGPRPDIGVIDLMLPDGDGITLCRWLWEEHRLPTLLLTARDEDRLIVHGLDSGVGDYVVKPVRARVLEARLRAIIRRHTVDSPHDQQLAVGALIITEAETRLSSSNSLLPLTATEQRLLWELAVHLDRVVPRADLLDTVWRENPPHTDRVIDTTVQRLRAKLSAHNATEPVLDTVRGIGYRLR